MLTVSIVADDEPSLDHAKPTDPSSIGLRPPTPFVEGIQIAKIRRKLARVDKHDLDDERDADSDCSELSEIMSNFSLEDCENDHRPLPQKQASTTTQSHRGSQKYQEDFNPSHLQPSTPLKARPYSRALAYLDRVSLSLEPSSSGTDSAVDIREPSLSEASSQRSSHSRRKERAALLYDRRDYYRAKHLRSDCYRPDYVSNSSSSSSRRARGSRARGTSFRLQRQEKDSKGRQSDLCCEASTKMKVRKDYHLHPARRNDRRHRSPMSGHVKTSHAGDNYLTQPGAVIDSMEICSQESNPPRIEEGRKIVPPTDPKGSIPSN